MDPASLVSGLMAAQTGRVQLAVAARLMRMNADMENSVAQLLDAAQANGAKLAQAALGIGTQLDITV
jgi:hypothetical protein